MGILFYKTTDMNASNHVKIPMSSSGVLKSENDEKKSFIWSILASLYPCQKSHPNRVSNYRRFLYEINVQDFEFTNGFECSLVQKFGKLKKYMSILN